MSSAPRTAEPPRDPAPSPAPSTGSRGLALGMALVALVTLLGAVPGTWVQASHGAQTTGDEPHYLLTAISLAEDGDLDVADELADERFRTFHADDLRQQAAHTGESAVVPHDPLLPALLAPAWALGGWVGAKLLMAALAALTAAMALWLAVRRFGARVRPAALTVAALSSTGTLAIYGTQLYPELPAALAVLVAVAAATGPPRPREEVALILAVTALPWLAVKYVPVAATLALIHLVRHWRAGRRRRVATTVAVLGLAGVAYLLLHLAWYGGATVYAAGAFFQEHGGQLSVLGTEPDYLGRSRRIVGLLVDRHFGLAAWQPAWLLVPGAVAALARRRPEGGGLLLVTAAVGWLTATFLALTMQGWWFPGRQVVVVLPLLAIALALWASRHGLVAAALAGLGALGAVTHGWLLVQGLRGGLTLVVDFASVGSPLYRAWMRALPDYLEVTTTTWVLHGLWAAALVLLAVAGWHSAARSRARVGPGP